MSCNHPAGVACHCNRSGACLVSYQVDSDAGSLRILNGEAGARVIALLDEGEGATVSVSVEGNCSNGLSDCPSGYITDNRYYSEAVSAQACKNYTLHYNSADGSWMDFLGAMKNLLAEDKTAGISSTRYQLCVTQCAGKPQIQRPVWTVQPISYLLGHLPQDTYIDVYPKVEIEAELTMKGKTVKEALSDAERYEAYQRLESSGELDGVSIPAEHIKKQFTIEGALTISQGSIKTVFSAERTTTHSNLPGVPQVKNLQDAFENVREQIKTIDAIVSIIEQVKQGTYNSAGQDKVKLVKFELDAPEISIKGKQTLMMAEQKIATEGEVSVAFAPLFGFSMTLDLLLAAAAYFKMEKPVEAIRQKAKELEELVKAGHSGAYAGAEFDVTIAAGLATTGNIRFMPGQAPQYGFDAVTTVSILAAANIRGGAKVWVLEGAFKFEAEVIAEGQCALRCTLKNDEPNVELIFFHKGIRAKVSIELSASLNGEKTNSGSGNNAFSSFESDVTVSIEVSKKEQKEWVWVQPLTEKNSKYRATLIGSS